MALPSIVPSKFAGTSLDFTKAKVDASGAVRQTYTTVTVPSGTTTTTVVGLYPFRKGFSLNQAGTQLYVANIGDGSSTLDIGYVYSDAVTYTSDPDAFASAVTTSQAGGLITFDEFAGLSWVAAADGWIAVTIGGSTTDASGAIQGQIAFTYDQA